MQEYLVDWRINVSAVSPEAAARQAQAYQRDPTAIVGVFDVFDQQGKETRVDLDELDGVDVN